MSLAKHKHRSGALGLAALCLASFSSWALAHQESKHPARPRENSTAQAKENTSSMKIALEEVGRSYKARVEPIFQNKCLQCHGGTPTLPWYYKVPGIRQLIDRDLEESKHHIDFSKGYPFVSHATPIEDLQAIKESMEKKDMPPFVYLLAHGAHRLTEEERKTVMQWTQEGIARLKQALQSSHEEAK